MAGLKAGCPLKCHRAQSAFVARAARPVCGTGVWTSLLRHLALLLDL